jgi:hypothetical protein
MDRSAVVAVRSPDNPLESRAACTALAQIALSLSIEHAPALFYRELMGFSDASAAVAVRRA